MGSLNIHNESGEMGGRENEDGEDMGDDSTAWGNLDDSVSSNPSAPSSPSPFGRMVGKFGKNWGQSKPSKPVAAPPKRAATPPTSSLISLLLLLLYVIVFIIIIILNFLMNRKYRVCFQVQHIRGE